MTLDVEMPHMDGVEFLRRLMPQYPIPVIMVSAVTQRSKRITLEALEAGAVDFVPKPDLSMPAGRSGMLMELRTKVKIASTANVSHWKRSRPTFKPAGSGQSPAKTAAEQCVIAVGGSTGGPEAIRVLLEGMPATSPGVLIVVHMPPGFTSFFADGLNQASALEVKEAADGDRIVPGRALVAKGDTQMRVAMEGGVCVAKVQESGPVGGHAPSVDVMMQSVAEVFGSNAIGVLLSGMGQDGAKGMTAIRQAGGRTLAQDEETCVVFGMPREAWKRGAAERLVPLPKIAAAVADLVSR
jgi:two-component system chemotaxis response regulator CheB